MIFIGSFSCTQTFAESSPDEVKDYFQNILKSTIKIQRNLIDFSKDIPEYDRSTYNSVYEVSSSVYSSSKLISSISSLDPLIDIKYKSNYVNYIMLEIKDIKKQMNTNVRRLDQLSGSLIRHPGLQRSTKDLTEICIKINNKF